MLKVQPAQAAFASRSQVFWLSIFNPLIGTWPYIAALGGDHQPCRIRVQCLSYDFFTHARTIRIGSIDEIYAQFHSASQDPDGLCPVCRLAPNSVSRNSHRAESQAGNTKIVFDQEFARLLSRCLASLHCEFVIRHMFFLSSTKTDASNCSSRLESRDAGGVAKKSCPLPNGVSVGAATATDASLTPTMNERREFTDSRSL